MDFDKTILIKGQNFNIQYLDSDNKNAVARIKENLITIKLPRRWPHKARLEAAENLEKRIIKKLAKPQKKIKAVPENLTEQEKRQFACNSLPTISARIDEFNSSYFNSHLGKIRIRSNLTNWGSCSTKNNISINFALLFLPQELLDYVIVHELAHTKVRNHSQRFWQIVGKILPDYKNRKKELRRYSLTN